MHLTGEEETLLKLVSYSSAFQEQDGHGCLPLHEAAAQLNKRILEITLKGKGLGLSQAFLLNPPCMLTWY